MARRARRTLLLLAVVVAVIAVLRRRQQREPALAEEGAPTWPPLADVAVAPGPEHSPVRAPGEAQTPPPGQAWVLPEGGECPVTHPVKAKVLTGIFHAPGSANYARTRPDRCYRDAAAAEADGLRPPRRRS